MEPPQPALSDLRPALELALEVAQKILTRESTGPLPGRVRQLLLNRRGLPRDWQVTMRRVLDEDDAFRQVVAEASAAEETSEEAAEERAEAPGDRSSSGREPLDRIAQLWLLRPEGWETELTELVETRVEIDSLARDLSEWRRRATEAEEELARLRQANDPHGRGLVTDEPGRGAGEERRRRDLEARLSGAESRVQRLEAALRRQEKSEAEARAVADSAQQAQAVAEAELESVRGDLAELTRKMETEAGVDRVVDMTLSTAREAVEEAASAASSAAAEIGRALERALSVLGTGAASPASGVDGAARESRRRPVAPPSAAARRRFGGHRRHPLLLPPAVFEDSLEAADHLLRRTRAQVVVDGYNVALTSWGRPVSSTDLPQLRQRLLDSLSELALRHPRDITVVFDGTDQGGRATVHGPARPWVRVVFSASAVEADEVIVESVKTLPSHVPVVVVTDDRAVRTQTARLGANVLSVGQLMGVLGRRVRQKGG